MNLKAIKNYLLASLFGQGSYFVIASLIINYFGENVYADIELFYVYTTLISAVFYFNISTSITRMKYAIESKKYFIKYYSSILLFGLIVAIGLSSLSRILPNVILEKLNISNQLIQLLGVGSLVLFLNSWFQNILVVSKDSRKYRNLLIVSGILKILLVIILSQLVVQDYASTKVVLEIIFILLLMYMFAPKLDFNFESNFQNYIKKGLRFSAPLMLYVIVNNVLNYSDQIMITNYLGKDELAIYSLSYRIGMVVLMIYSALANFFNIKYYDGLKLKSHDSLMDVYLILLMFVSSLIIIGFKGYALTLLTNWNGVDLENAKKVIGLVIFGYFINLPFLLFSRWLFYNEKNWVISILTAMGACFNILLNIYLLSNGTVVDAALATAFSFGLIFLFTVYLNVRNNWVVDPRSLVVHLFCGIVLYFSL